MIENTRLTLESCLVLSPFEPLQCVGMDFSAEGKISAIHQALPAEPHKPHTIHLNGLTVIPGLVDIHVHGGMGVSFGTGALETDLEKYGRFAASHGVSGFLLSITGPDAAFITRVVREYAAIFNARAEWPGAVPLGMHLEGPFINPARHGAFNPAWIHNPGLDEAKTYLDAGCGWVRQVSMAPELPGAEAVARLFKDAGVAISLGHSNTTYAQASEALKGVFSHVTHTFNAQSPLHQREPGVVGAVLASDQITAELIGDGVHVHPAVMKILYRCLGAERIVLITDAMQGAGLPDGEYELLNQKVTVREGKATLPDGTIGGSTGTLDLCLRNMVALVGANLSEAARMAGYNPLGVIGLNNETGCIALGQTANLTVLDDELNVCRTIVKGKSVYSKEEG